MRYNISAMVVYSDEIEADDENEAIAQFFADCPYDIDEESIICEEEKVDNRKIIPFRTK